MLAVCFGNLKLLILNQILMLEKKQKIKFKSKLILKFKKNTPYFLLAINIKNEISFIVCISIFAHYAMFINDIFYTGLHKEKELWIIYMNIKVAFKISTLKLNYIQYNFKFCVISCRVTQRTGCMS